MVLLAKFPRTGPSNFYILCPVRRTGPGTNLLLLYSETLLNKQQQNCLMSVCNTQPGFNTIDTRHATNVGLPTFDFSIP